MNVSSQVITRQFQVVPHFFPQIPSELSVENLRRLSSWQKGKNPRISLIREVLGILKSENVIYSCAYACKENTDVLRAVIICELKTAMF